MIIFYKSNQMTKKTLKTISIALDPEILQKLEEGKYNRSKLIDSLVTKFLDKEEKKRAKKI